LEDDAEAIERPAARLGDQGNRIVRAGIAGVLDEVRMARRDDRAATPEAPQAARLQHSSRRQLVLRILEDAAERPLVRRLSGLPPGLHVGDYRPDLLGRARLELEVHLGDDLSR